MKSIKKIFCLALSLGMAFGATACSAGGQEEGTKGVLSIASFEGGYGATWITVLEKAYEAHNPGVEVNVKCDALVRDEAVTAFQTNVTPHDLFFVDGLSVGSLCENYGSLADMSEFYNSKPKAGANEENILIKDKIRPELIEEMTYGGDRTQFAGKYYTVPSPSGPCSLVLNVDALNSVLGEGNWSEPATTDELIALCDAIVSAKKRVNIEGVDHLVYPFIYSGKALEYWRYLYYTWIAQYGGDVAWEEFNTVRRNGVYDQAAFQPTGKLEAYQMLEKLIKRANGYCDTSSMGNEFNASQKYFLQGRACMYVTGDWLEREMEGSKYQTNLKMVKTPIISNLSAKLESDYSASLGATDAEKDAKLAEIVKAIDNGNTSVSGVSEEVFNAVKKARAYTFTLANSAIGAIPAVSINKDLAIDFLRFMYSDEGIQIILQETKSYLPVVNATDFTYNGTVSMFRQSVNKIAEGEITYIFTSSRDPIRYRAGLESYITNEKPEAAMGKKSNAVTAYAYLETERNLLAQTWQDIMDQVQ